MMSGHASQALLALGSNLGDRAAFLDAAVASLAAEPGVCVLARSSIYETAPIGTAARADFLNATVAVATTLGPEGLLAVCQRIESGNGRVRSVPNAPRTLDVDMVFFGNEERCSARLTLPHPRYAGRAFVCVPLAEMLALPPLNAERGWDWLRARLDALPGGLRHPSPACRPWKR
ncbi:MAG: 2-amino-4-hydroxy-6-hydroxymethyldihydropteridine diphosphokinase [Puniceicoccales bacterium]|nr:2-amino-4-hydroxy-6-hydroxymethyldihydropteridine diphosphokinase [Puniceicoccales bacterium]